MLQQIGKTELLGSRMALGCMRMAALEPKAANEVLATALEVGVNFFDHADIYGAGASEERFAGAVKALGVAREDLLIQSKCGIRPGFFDFSQQHILDSVDGILRRLNTDYLDVLALHRPDILLDPQEVAQAFTKLKETGKVRHFGVSNQNRYQMELLQAYLDEPLVVNQLQLSPAHTPMFDAGVNVNMWGQAAANRDGGILEYCRLHGVTVQAWSPFQIDLGQGLFATDARYQQLNDTLARLAAEFSVSSEAMVLAWINRHPAQIQTIVGSMNPQRIRAMALADRVSLTRPQWYEIYTSASNVLP
ncbi:MAG: aldo/keto reductase [Actinomycetaceae bacterium]|nr:aldo/keto reductase [Actinomycetaceae bacterium]